MVTERIRRKKKGGGKGGTPSPVVVVPLFKRNILQKREEYHRLRVIRPFKYCRGGGKEKKGGGEGGTLLLFEPSFVREFMRKKGTVGGGENSLTFLLLGWAGKGRRKGKGGQLPHMIYDHSL